MHRFRFFLQDKKRAILLGFFSVLLLLGPLTLAILSVQAATVNPLAGINLDFDYERAPYSATADLWESTRPTDASLMRKIAEYPMALWYAEDWNPANKITGQIDTIMKKAASKSAVPVFVVYSIPKRDCGTGGSPSMAAYQNWVQLFANGINNRQAIVIIEPDALALFDCLSAQERTDRLSMVQHAVTTFKAQGSYVYIDGGHSHWLSVNTLVSRLNTAGIAQADGFSLNVSNFYTNEDLIAYGNQVSSQVGNKHFVLDTSRNGLGGYTYPPTGRNQWCNPPGRAIGLPPTTNTGIPTVDAFFWVKGIGNSDGPCTEFGQNDPPAGTFMPEYALGLAQRTDWMVASLTPTSSPTPTSITPTATNTPTPVPNGLTASYFANKNLSGTPVLTRIDSTVNFQWGTAKPHTLVPADNFSVRWTGFVIPQYSQTYTFYTQSDDGVRLWINGKQLVNNWTNHSPTENKGTIALTAGQKYTVVNSSNKFRTPKMISLVNRQ